MRRRVVVTGAGCVSPLGADVATTWQRLIRGESGAGPIRLFDASEYPVRIAAEADQWSLESLGPLPDEWSGLPRQTLFAISAAEEARRAAGWEDALAGRDPRRVGISLGCGEIFPDLQRLGRLVADSLCEGRLDRERFVTQAWQTACPGDEMAMEPGSAVGYIAGRLNTQGPGANFTTACVSSSIAIGEAVEVIRRGEADAMLAGGTHSMIHPMGIGGFHRLSTLSTRNDEPRRASRPFERDRDGFVVGEGGAVLVLEEYESARRRGAGIWAELAGYGCNHDAYRVSDPVPDGRHAARCIQRALEDAGLTADDVDHVNAHGSGTIANDAAETVAIKRAFGDRAARLSVSGTKSMTGHLTTACGALEFLFCVLAVRDGVVPPTINYETPDPECDLDFVANEARRQKVRAAVSNSFGFGGQNCVLVASQWKD